MNARQRSNAPRLFLLLAVGLLFLTTHLPGGAAQVAPEQAGLTYLAALQGTSPLASSSLMVSQKAVLHTPEGIYHGRDGIDEFASFLQGAFSDLSFVIRNPSISGNDIVMHFVMTGTYTGSYQRLATNCAGIKVPGVAVLSLDDTGIAEQWISYDVSTLVAQIDGFHQLDPSNKPDCSSLTVERPAPVADCVRRDRCDQPYDLPMSTPDCARRDRCDAWS